MVRLEGVVLPDGKRVEFGLGYLFGIGLTRSREILKNTGINPDTRIKDLQHEQVAAIQKYINQNFKVEGELRKEVTLDIKRLQEIGCYRGLRHKRSLPVRGQRTKTNARTRKGPRKATNVVAAKKTVSKK
jgi:small subunit ribosomal protein S13